MSDQEPHDERPGRIGVIAVYIAFLPLILFLIALFLTVSKV